MPSHKLTGRGCSESGAISHWLRSRKFCIQKPENDKCCEKKRECCGIRLWERITINGHTCVSLHPFSHLGHIHTFSWVFLLPAHSRRMSLCFVHLLVGSLPANNFPVISKTLFNSLPPLRQRGKIHLPAWKVIRFSLCSTGKEREQISEPSTTHQECLDSSIYCTVTDNQEFLSLSPFSEQNHFLLKLSI